MAEKLLSGVEKAAVLLKILPPQIVDNIFGRMDPRQVDMLRREQKKIEDRGILQEATATVLDEAARALTDARAGSAAGKPALRLVTPEPEPPKAPPKPEPKIQVDSSDPLDTIAKLPPDLLARALENESTRTISLLMNYLEIEAAGQIYKRLSPAKRREVSMRFTEHAAVNEGLLRRIAQAVLQKCETLRVSTVTGATEPGAREKRMAALLRGLERTERMDMLGILEQSDAELAGRIKSMLYQFEDVLRMQNLSVQKLLTQIDTKSLAQALSGAAPELREKILSNLSKRAQESLKEEIDLAGTVPSAKARQAQQVIVDAIQGLDQRGELVLIE
jgi:flagellar motor switch protein FliG